MDTLKVIDVLNAILKVAPNATVDQDMDGQLVIYTDLKVTSDDSLVPFADDDPIA